METGHVVDELLAARRLGSMDGRHGVFLSGDIALPHISGDSLSGCDRTQVLVARDGLLGQCVSGGGPIRRRGSGGG